MLVLSNFEIGHFVVDFAVIAISRTGNRHKRFPPSGPFSTGQK